MNQPTARIDLSTIASNYQALATYASSAETAAVVKADAYGHGAVQVGQALSELGCKTFFVAYAFEGAELRSAIGKTAAIYVLNGPSDPNLETFHSHNLRPVLNTPEALALWARYGSDQAYAIHVDTGMNRLGLKWRDDLAKATLFRAAPPSLVMSHLACGDEPDADMNARQLEAFKSVCQAFPNSKHSLSATAGVYLGPDFHFDLVRPGIGLYGGGPPPPASVKLTPAMSLTAPILSTFDVTPGETTGYGATHSFDAPARLATVSLGYADGFLRSGSNAGWGVLHGKRCPIVGRVSMDLITLDITDVGTNVKAGDRVEFIGPQAGLESQAKALGTLSYELTSGLGHRISRHWI